MSKPVIASIQSTQGGTNIPKKPRAYGMLALFEDGDIARHSSMLLKTHCIRTIMAPWERWQRYPHIQDAPADENGYQLHRFKGGHRQYHWVPSEAWAAHYAREFLDKPQQAINGNVGLEHPLNKELFERPMYTSVEVVEVKIVWQPDESPGQVIAAVNTKALGSQFDD